MSIALKRKVVAPLIESNDFSYMPESFRFVFADHAEIRPKDSSQYGGKAPVSSLPIPI